LKNIFVDKLFHVFNFPTNFRQAAGKGWWGGSRPPAPSSYATGGSDSGSGSGSDSDSGSGSGSDSDSGSGSDSQGRRSNSRAGGTEVSRRALALIMTS